MTSVRVRPYGSARCGQRYGMYIGLGIVLLVLGLILVLDVITVDLSFVDDGALGTILIVAGALAIVLSLLYAPPWRREARDTVVHHRDDPRY